MNEKQIVASYNLAKEIYGGAGVDTDKVLEKLQDIPVSLHIWQSDDVGGFEEKDDLGGGLAVTGSNPGKARNID